MDGIAKEAARFSLGFIGLRGRSLGFRVWGVEAVSVS